jgi:hypothetical protein|nr:MAG TPA: hypothetical protein [Caudoviricetes sp.]
MKKRYYIAYGSNLNVEQMAFRCPGAEAVGTAVLENHTLFFRGSQTGSYLTIEPKIGGKVPVAIWAVTAADEAALDRYEGYPNFYYKADFTLDVTPLGGGESHSLECFAYIMNEGRPIGLPTDFYLQTCLEGYERFGFDKRILLRTVERMRRTLCRRMKSN